MITDVSRIVKGFGLNQLQGPDSGVELPRDPALPRDKPRLSWQLLSRTFAAFVFLDSFAMAWMPGHVPAFDTRMYYCDLGVVLGYGRVSVGVIDMRTRWLRAACRIWQGTVGPVWS